VPPGTAEAVPYVRRVCFRAFVAISSFIRRSLHAGSGRRLAAPAPRSSTSGSAQTSRGCGGRARTPAAWVVDAKRDPPAGQAAARETHV